MVFNPHVRMLDLGIIQVLGELYLKVPITIYSLLTKKVLTFPSFDLVLDRLLPDNKHLTSFFLEHLLYKFAIINFLCPFEY